MAKSQTKKIKAEVEEPTDAVVEAGEAAAEEVVEEVKAEKPAVIHCPMTLEKLLRDELVGLDNTGLKAHVKFNAARDVVLVIENGAGDLVREFEIIGDLTKNVTELTA